MRLGFITADVFSDFFRYALNYPGHRLPAFGRSSYIEKHEFVRARFIIVVSQLYRVAGIFELNEAGSLYDPAVFYVQTGYYAPR